MFSNRGDVVFKKIEILHRVLLKTLTLIDVNSALCNDDFLIRNDHWGPKMPFIPLEVVELEVGIRIT